MHCVIQPNIVDPIFHVHNIGVCGLRLPSQAFSSFCFTGTNCTWPAGVRSFSDNVIDLWTSFAQGKLFFCVVFEVCYPLFRVQFGLACLCRTMAFRLCRWCKPTEQVATMVPPTKYRRHLSLDTGSIGWREVPC